MRKDLIGSITLLGVAAAYYAASTTIFSSALADEVGADGIPVLLAALLAVIALALGVQAFVRVPAPAKPAGAEGEAEAGTGPNESGGHGQHTHDHGHGHGGRHQTESKPGFFARLFGRK